MGGNMTWPRFRRRNLLDLRPNYYCHDGNPLPVPESEYERRNRYLSGEIDRMVYGWWMSEPFQVAIAEAAGITTAQVDMVMQFMLTADNLPGRPPE